MKILYFISCRGGGGGGGAVNLSVEVGSGSGLAECASAVEDFVFEEEESEEV